MTNIGRNDGVIIIKLKITDLQRSVESIKPHLEVDNGTKKRRSLRPENERESRPEKKAITVQELQKDWVP